MSDLQFLDFFVLMHLTTQKTAMNNATIPAMIPNTTPTMCPGLKYKKKIRVTPDNSEISKTRK